MNKAILMGYQKDIKELTIVNKALIKLNNRLEAVPVVCGKVSSSGHSFPYIESHVTVEMAEPKESDRLKKRIREKEKHREELLFRIKSVEKFIDALPDGIEKEIFEMVFLDGMTQKEVGDAVGYTKGRISQIISSYAKD